MANICPVCGYPGLDHPAYDGEMGSLDICVSCGFQFGWTDNDQDITQEQWRQQWIEQGMLWQGIDFKAPKNWDPRRQLLNIGVKV